MALCKALLALSSVLLLYIVFPVVVGANKVVHFPDEELASEYVFPIFDNPQAVMDRNVSLAKRFEFFLSTGFRIDEPLYHILNFSGGANFYWNEFSGLGVSGLFFMPGLSPTGRKLQTQGVRVKKKPKRTLPIGSEQAELDRRREDISSPDSLTNRQEKIIYFDPLLAPHPFFATFLNYYFSPLYGKVSVTKKMVFNFSLYTFSGLGVMGFKHGSSTLIMNPAGQIGIGQKSYINKWMAFNVGMSLVIYRGPNPISSVIVRDDTQPAIRQGPAYSQFRKTIFVRFLVQVGWVFLI